MENENENINDNINKELLFKEKVFSFNIYPEEMLNSFFNYWSEKSKTGKMRWEMEKTYEISKRLQTWFNREKPEPEPQKFLSPFDMIPR